MITNLHIEEFIKQAHRVGDAGLSVCSSGNLSWRIGDEALVSGTGSWVPTIQKEKISQLLQTIQKAGKCCTVIGELLENQRIFQVVPFTAADAYTLLNAHDVLENSGIALRMVNLWKRRPPKLKLELTLTNPSGGELSEHALLHFKTEAVLDGQGLKKAELDELLKSSGGLVRFKEKWVEADGEKVRKLLELWGRPDRFSQHAGLSFTA